MTYKPKSKNNCINCANSVGKDHCTMQKDMKTAQYVKCDGHKIIEKKPKPIKIVIWNLNN